MSQSHEATGIEVQPTFSILRYSQKRMWLSILRDCGSEFLIKKTVFRDVLSRAKINPSTFLISLLHTTPSWREKILPPTFHHNLLPVPLRMFQ